MFLQNCNTTECWMNMPLLCNAKYNCFEIVAENFLLGFSTLYCYSNLQYYWIFKFSLLYIWRARCKNGLSDDFGPPFTKPPNYLLSCNVTVAKWIVSCSQNIVLVTWIEFPPKLYQVTLLLARKVKLPKCEEIPIISAGGKKEFCCCPWWMWL